jgi:hypothetical protein
MRTRAGGKAMIALAVPPTLSAYCLLPATRSLPDWHRLTVEAIGRGLSPAHAALFATPVLGHNGTTWQTEGDHALAFVLLPADERAQMTAAIGSMLSDIRRLVESGLMPELAPLWPALREVPDQSHIFLVDGRPVLAAWAHRGAAGSLAAGYDDGLAGLSPPAPRTRMAGYALPLLALALFALLAGVLIMGSGSLWAVSAPALCRVNPAQLAALATLRREMDQGNSLRTLLAQLMEERGQRQLQCPIPKPPPPVVQKAPPPQLPGLTQTLWDKRDLSVLKGCWKLHNAMTLTNDKTKKTTNIQSWQMCFDNAGNGMQTILDSDGTSCNGPLSAHFNNSTLVITEPQRCTGGLTLDDGSTSCQRVSANEADCDRVENEGPGAGMPTPSQFRR